MRRSYPVLDPVSQAYPEVEGRSPTCYSPVRRSCTPKGLTARLACVKHAASVRPEPGSNSPTKNIGTNSPSKKPGPHWQTRTRPLKETPRHHTPQHAAPTRTNTPNIRHTVEFSKDNHTRITRPIPAQFPGGVSLLYPTPSGP